MSAMAVDAPSAARRPTARARISRLDRVSVERETVLGAWRSLPFNSPNDFVVAPDGAVWFTDPSSVREAWESAAAVAE